MLTDFGPYVAILATLFPPSDGGKIPGCCAKLVRYVSVVFSAQWPAGLSMLLADAAWCLGAESQ